MHGTLLLPRAEHVRGFPPKTGRRDSPHGESGHVRFVCPTLRFLKTMERRSSNSSFRIYECLGALPVGAGSLSPAGRKGSKTRDRQRRGRGFNTSIHGIDHGIRSWNGIMSAAMVDFHEVRTGPPKRSPEFHLSWTEPADRAAAFRRSRRFGP